MDAIKLDPPWRQAVEDANATFGYGEMIAKDWLMNAFEIEHPEKITDVKRASFSWLKSMTNFRRMLNEKYKKELSACPGRNCYLVVKPDLQTDYAIAEGKREMRGMFRRYERRLNVDISLISIDEARKNSETRAKLAALKAFSSKQIENDSHDKGKSMTTHKKTL